MLEELRADPIVGLRAARPRPPYAPRLPAPAQRAVRALARRDRGAARRRARRSCASAGIETGVFVPPYNRFDARQYEPLARRFAVVGGGPESVPLIGFHRTPVWRGDAVYLPSYFPLYGRAADVLPAAQSLIERQAGLWTPIVLHWGWEADADWADLERLASADRPLHGPLGRVPRRGAGERRLMLTADLIDDPAGLEPWSRGLGPPGRGAEPALQLAASGCCPGGGTR